MSQLLIFPPLDPALAGFSLPPLPGGFSYWRNAGEGYASDRAEMITSIDVADDDGWDAPAMFKSTGMEGCHYLVAVTEHHRVCRCEECPPLAADLASDLASGDVIITVSSVVNGTPAALRFKRTGNPCPECGRGPKGLGVWLTRLPTRESFEFLLCAECGGCFKFSILPKAHRFLRKFAFDEALTKLRLRAGEAQPSTR